MPTANTSGIILAGVMHLWHGIAIPMECCPRRLQLGQAQITIFFITILRHFFYDFTAFFYDFVTMLREHSLPYRPMFSLVFKPKNWQ